MMLNELRFGPQVPECDRTHAEKHRLPGESFSDAQARVAHALKDDEAHFRELHDVFLNMRFAPGGRVQAAMGSGRNTTAYNCYVGGNIADSFVDDEGSIMDRAKEAAATMRMGGGLGNNFSTLRPSGALIKKLGSNSAGPLPFMHIFDRIGRATASSGHRRGAQMGVLNISHPDIEEFIEAKQPSKNLSKVWDLVIGLPNGPEKNQMMAGLQETLQLTGFNLSLGVTDDFMEAKYAGKPYKLHWGGKTYKEIDPQELWHKAMKATWDWGEPGVLFLDTMNRMNPLYYCELIVATNPCGEQPFPPNGACLLGSFNLTKYIYQDFSGKLSFDWEQFERDIPVVVRAMDNVVDRTNYPVAAQKIEAKNKRRMGLGVFGLANAGEALGFPYGSPEFIDFEAKILDTLRDHSFATGAKLAKEKGSFPLYDAEKYQKSEFFKTLSPWVQELIRQNGLRNSHYGSIAPTGTMAFTHDNASSGIEPVFSYTQERDILDATGKRTEIIQDYGVRMFGVKGKRCADVTIDEHLAVLATAAKRIDSAVSKTCNVSPKMPWDEFIKVYDRAWELGCKGITTFNPEGKRFGVLRSIDTEVTAANEDAPAPACTFDLASGRKSCE